MQRHDYAGADDLRAMQGLVQRIWSPRCRWHVGDLAWGRYAIPGAAADFRTALWLDGDQVVGWGWAEVPGYLSWVVDPAVPDVATEVLAWFEGVAESAELTTTVLQPEAHLVDALAAAGYSPDRAAPYFVHHHRALEDVEECQLPDGFRLRQVQLGEAAPRAAVHRTGWSDFGSRVSAESYADVMAAWPYRPELDWVVETDDGEWVASALGWLDDQNAVGLIEPVGCAPAYRRLGLARAVNLAVLQAFREAGATSALVGPRGDDAYPVPARLYRSIGFEPGARTVTYHRPG
ncbi:MAG: GNAT family N-acetyltransferase [Nocardioidaceae bacterium]